MRLIILIFSWVCIVAYPAALMFGLKFANPLYELPLVVLFLLAVLNIRAHYRKPKSND